MGLPQQQTQRTAASEPEGQCPVTIAGMTQGQSSRNLESGNRRGKTITGCQQHLTEEQKRGVPSQARVPKAGTTKWELCTPPRSLWERSTPLPLKVSQMAQCSREQLTQQPGAGTDSGDSGSPQPGPGWFLLMTLSLMACIPGKRKP